ncbi:hypothetical protein Droror1_Dr00024303 [Drosera rotundifolia]
MGPAIRPVLWLLGLGRAAHYWWLLGLPRTANFGQPTTCRATTEVRKSSGGLRRWWCEAMSNVRLRAKAGQQWRSWVMAAKRCMAGEKDGDGGGLSERDREEASVGVKGREK